MLSNFHTHTTFCDGENTPEEIVRAAIEKGFSAIGFSGHGYTEYDLRYCMKDIDWYITEIKRLKNKYKEQIQIYLGVEEDAFAYVNRGEFDYIIGSSHYFCFDGCYYSFDSNYDYFEKCLHLFAGNAIKMAETYYQNLCKYIFHRKPDIIGHFDLVTKFDEKNLSSFYLNDARYENIVRKYLLEILKCDSIFEVNTGLIARGLRHGPCPNERLLYTIKKNDGKVMLSSDSHSIETLDFGFEEMRRLLREIGFEYVYTLYNNEWIKDYLSL